MSHTDRDQPGGHPARHHDFYDCQCCPILVPKARSPKRTTRERLAEAFEQIAEDDAFDLNTTVIDQHCYDGERCIRCGINVYDTDLDPDGRICPDRDDEPISYTTETGVAPAATHDFFRTLEGLHDAYAR